MTLNPPRQCPTCGDTMRLKLVSNTQPIYAAVCQNVTVKHPATVLLPAMIFDSK